MKKFLSLFVSFALILTVSSFSAPASVSTKAAVNSIVTELSTVYSGVVIGDSIAEGHPFSHGRLHDLTVAGHVGTGGVNLNFINYGHTIAKYLEDHLNMPVYNHGRGGQTTTQIRTRWNRDVLAQASTTPGPEAPQYSGKTLDKIPDFVVINCGINDLVTGGMTASTIESNFTFMLDSCKTNNIIPVIINLGVRNGTDAPLNAAQITMRTEVNAWLLAQKNSGNYPTMKLIDFYTWATDTNNNKYVAGSPTFNNTTGYIYDGLHPNEAGYDALAAKIYTEANLVDVIKVPVTQVSLDRTSATLKVTKTLQLNATVSPVDASNKAVTWSTSNSKVAVVSPTGLVTARARGYATITVKTADGAKTATCKFTVTQPVRSVVLNRKTLTLRKGSTYRLIATVYPTNANNKKVTWKSGSKSIATVSYKGLVKGIRRGSVYVTVCTADGKKTARCRVTVK